MDDFTPALHLSALSSHIIHTVLYYDIFQHPLKEDEIYTFLGCNTIITEQLHEALDELVTNGILHSEEGYYHLAREKGMVIRRKKGNARAAKMLPVARKMSRLISWFPFVRGVGISGSLSKNYMDSSSDIDFFVITTPGRLWIARTLLMLFKKAFLLNSRKYFCLNYFISTSSLQIRDQNVFTATELITMIPTYGRQPFKQFYAANQWVREFLPNSRFYDPENVRKDRSLAAKWVMEFLLNGALGTWLDTQCMKLTTRVWRKKFKGMDRREFDLALRSRKDVSKHHPQNFQKKVLQRLEEKTSAFEAQYGWPITDKKKENYG